MPIIHSTRFSPNTDLRAYQQKCAFVVCSAPCLVERVNSRAVSSAGTPTTHRPSSVTLSPSRQACSSAGQASTARPTAVDSMTQVTTGELVSPSCTARMVSLPDAWWCLPMIRSANSAASLICLWDICCCISSYTSWLFR